MQATLERLRQRREERGDEGGFTLIELLIVIVILGILAAIVVFAVQNLTGQSAKSACGSDFKSTETALEAYKAQLGAYPTTAQGLTRLTTTGLSDSAGNSVGPWLKDNPPTSAASGHYYFSYATTATGYTLTVDNHAGAAQGTTEGACSTIS